MYPTRVANRTQGVGSEAADALKSAERQVIEQVLAGETAAFRVLVERYQRGVHAVIYRLTHSAADADDLAQQAFLSAYDSLASFKTDFKFSSWLYRIAINLAKDHLKSKKHTEAGLSDLDPGPDAAAFAGTLPAPDAGVITSERQQLLQRALHQLSFDDREVLILKDIEELSYEEMKQILGRPITALKIRVVRARQRLKSAIDRLAEKGAI
jgi:RNA polymerase sigma-70 factor (ECF subfamily)